MAEDPGNLTPCQYVLKLVHDGETSHETRVRRYDEAYDVYRASPPKGVRKETWESKLRVKYGMQVIDTALVNIVGGVPRAKIRPRRPQDEATAPKMQQVLDYYVAADHLAEKQPLFVQQALIYPLTAAKTHWLYKEQPKTVRQFHPNPVDPGSPLTWEAEERIVLRDGPTFEPWDIYDLWWEPNARDVDTAAYIVLRSWLSKDEVLMQARSETNPYGMFDPAAVALLLEEGPSPIGSRSTAQDRLLGGSAVKRKDRIEFLEVWRETPQGLRQTVIGGRKVVAVDRPSPYYHGQKPVVVVQTRPDMFEMAGISETEVLSDLQDAMNSLMNMRMDNLHLTVQRGLTYRESGVVDPNQLVLTPRYKWGVTDHDDIAFQNPPPLPPEAYREDEVLLSRMQLVTGINPYISGADLNTVDQNTATGVTALQEVASRLLRFKARQVAYKGYQRVFEQWGDLVQQFMTRTEAIRIEGDQPDTYDWTEVSPQEIAGNYDYAVEGTEESLSRQQERGEAIALLNAFAPFIQMPGFNIRPVFERVARAYDMPPQQLFQAVQQPQAAPFNGGLPAAAQGNGEMPSMQNGQSLPPEIMAAVTGGTAPGGGGFSG